MADHSGDSVVDELDQRACVLYQRAAGKAESRQQQFPRRPGQFGGFRRRASRDATRYHVSVAGGADAEQLDAVSRARCPADSLVDAESATFSVAGQITSFDNNGTASPLVEGAYDAHYFSVDCDAFEELVFPAQLDISPGTPGPNVATFKTVPFNIDTTKPSVTSITLNPPGGYYAQNSAPTATVTCTDPSSPSVPNFFSGVAMCGSQTFAGNQQTVTTTPIPLNTAAIGTQTFSATAIDVAGNTSAASSVTYQVVGSADLATAMLANLLVKTGTNLTYYIAVVNGGPNTADVVTITDTLPSGNDVREFRVRHRILQLHWRQADMFDHAPEEFMWQRCRYLQPRQPGGMDENESHGSPGSDHRQGQRQGKYHNHQHGYGE